ncbi:MAG: hypothetical protein CMJ78_21910 [Planctomycetaceae bacterium]|nr:hypothetical protein [Planctomycetaceae bacterium]
MLFKKRPKQYEFAKRKTSIGPNVVAIIISSVAVVLLYQDYQAPIRPSPPAIMTGNQGSIEDELDNLIVASGVDEIKIVNDGTKGDEKEEKVEEPQLTPSQLALKQIIGLYDKSHADVAAVGSYSATFIKQERVNGSLLDKQEMAGKFNNDPHRVYFKYQNYDKGREVQYKADVEPEKLLVRKGGIAGRLLGALELALDNFLVTKENRYSIKMAGLLPLMKKALDLRRNDLTAESGVTCEQIDDIEVEGIMCTQFEIRYDDPSASKAAKDYKRSLVYFNKDTNFVVGVKNFGWATDGEEEEQMLEYYIYKDVDLEKRIADKDFSKLKKRSRG